MKTVGWIKIIIIERHSNGNAHLDKELADTRKTNRARETPKLTIGLRVRSALVSC
jgi:hypothetical protein